MEREREPSIPLCGRANRDEDAGATSLRMTALPGIRQYGVVL